MDENIIIINDFMLSSVMIYHKECHNKQTKIKANQQPQREIMEINKWTFLQEADFEKQYYENMNWKGS